MAYRQYEISHHVSSSMFQVRIHLRPLKWIFTPVSDENDHLDDDSRLDDDDRLDVDHHHGVEGVQRHDRRPMRYARIAAFELPVSHRILCRYGFDSPRAYRSGSTKYDRV
ncbi:hypothetical protein HYFRA_00013761 [Hymenoscyphus fraxineus]|uniref:Uncharacterized protein n=1 Tax=Hymenoscyphus fraxineus TaxID=746836 RepID=A0A9N9L6I9_9HELO|nr:hypothetical protein HYFRA_00013761 [Hymenoscyphus fraxineus]